MLQSIMSANNLTYSTMIDIIKLINLLIGEKKLPESQYLFKKVCTSGEINYVKYYFCKKCFKDFGDTAPSKNVCTDCSDNSIDYFVYSPIKSSLEKIVDGNFESIMSYREYINCVEPNTITDINNAMWYKNLSVTGDILTINMNTDGVAPFNASKKNSLWPILLTLNDLKPSDRFKKRNVLSAGYWMSEIPPVMEIFFKPFIEEMNNLNDEGINVRGKKFKIIVCSFCLDSVARAKCLRMKQFNGNFGCTFCLHPGGDKKYAYQNVTVRDFDHYQKSLEKWENLSDSEKKKGISIYGIKGRTELLDLHGFDPMKQVPVDFMHCVLLGVVKMLLNLWLNSVYHEKNWYVNKKKRKILDQKFRSIKTYSECTRKAGSLLDFRTFKANELFNFLFYYSKHCLSGLILPSEYYQHFLLLVDSMEDLYSNEFTLDKLDEIDKKLTCFVKDFEKLYGSEHVYYNVHLLLHITTTARLFGPLYSTSLFAFENMNGTLNRFLNGPKGPQVQICIKSYLYFGNFYSKDKRMSETALQFCEKTLNKSSNRYKYSNISRKYTYYELPEQITNPYNIHTKFRSYQKYYHKFIISSEEYSDNNKMYDDSFILYDQTFYRIEKILKSQDENDDYLYLLGRPIIVKVFSWLQNYVEIDKYGSTQLMKIEMPIHKCIHYKSKYAESLIIIKNCLIID